MRFLFPTVGPLNATEVLRRVMTHNALSDYCPLPIEEWQHKVAFVISSSFRRKPMSRLG